MSSCLFLPYWEAILIICMLQCQKFPFCQKYYLVTKCSTATVHSTSRPVSQIFTFSVTLFDPVFTIIKINTKCSTCIHQLQQSFCTQHYNRKIFSIPVPGDAFSLSHFLELPILKIYQRHGWLIFWTVCCKLPARERRWENNDNSNALNIQTLVKRITVNTRS